MQFKPITAIIVLLLVVASLLVAGCTSNTSDTTYQPANNAQSGKNTFTSTKAGYSITYPNTWGKDVRNNVAASVDEMLLLTMSSNAINVVTVASGRLNATTGTTLQTSTDGHLKALSRSYYDYTLQSFENTTLAGQPANKVVWQATVPQTIGNATSNAQIKTMQYFVVYNGVGYVLAYKTVKDDYNTYLTQAQEVINSFKFILSSTLTRVLFTLSK